MRCTVALFALIFISLGSTLRADSLALTAAGTAAGFSLTTFATGFPTDSNEANGTAGPLGIVFVNGGVLVSDAPGNLRFFASDVDNQSAITNATVIGSYGHNNALGLATVGNTVYMTEQSNGRLVTVNPTNGATQVVGGLANPTGIVTDPADNHLFVSSYQDNLIYDFDPATDTATVFLSAFFDGLSTDGTTLYGADPGNGHVYGYNILTHTLVFDSGPIAGTPDGTALGTGSLAGNLFVNTNGGNVFEINLATDVQTLIASNGTRGDFVAVDPNGTLLITQSSTVERLTPPPGGGFGTSTPLPSTAWAGVSLLGCLGMFKLLPLRRMLFATAS